jgi:hypothetical protein
MTAEIINLRQFRKARERAAKESVAAENRALSSRTRAGRELASATEDLAERRHAGHAVIGSERSDTSDDQPATSAVTTLPGIKQDE